MYRRIYYLLILFTLINWVLFCIIITTVIVIIIIYRVLIASFPNFLLVPSFRGQRIL